MNKPKRFLINAVEETDHIGESFRGKFVLTFRAPISVRRELRTMAGDQYDMETPSYRDEIEEWSYASTEERESVLATVKAALAEARK